MSYSQQRADLMTENRQLKELLRDILAAGIEGQSCITMCCPGDEGYPLRERIEAALDGGKGVQG